MVTPEDIVVLFLNIRLMVSILSNKSFYFVNINFDVLTLLHILFCGDNYIS